jgi:hypothetical protein
MNRRVLTKLTRKLAARRAVAKKKGQGAKAAVTEKQRKIIHELMRP